MACRGCSQVGDCACAVVGDGGSITVSGTGSALDPYVVQFTGATSVLGGLPQSDPNVCIEAIRVVARRADNSFALIPFKRCAVIL